MKKGYISILIIVLLFLFVSCISTEVYAGLPSADTIHGQANDFINKGASANKIDVNKIAAIMKPLASILLGIGTVVLVAVASVMGIKYMTSTPETQGKLKTQLFGVVVSAIVLYGAYGIWSITYKVVTDIVS